MSKDNKIKLLLDSLQYCNIKYVIWKNTNEINDALKGDEDLDILVDQLSYHKVRELLINFNFKEGINPFYSYPHIYHYYSHSNDINKLLHLHVYTNIITGESHTKNYNFPVSDIFLNNCINYKSFNIANPILLKAVFLLRYYIKISTTPGLLLVDQQKLKKEYCSIVEEDNSKPSSILNSFLVKLNINYPLYLSMRYAFERGNFIQKLLIALRIKIKIRTFRRYNIINNFYHRYWHLVFRCVNKVFIKTKKIPKNGGIIIGIIGSDGSGKSTLKKDIYNWLNLHYTTRSCHMGRPPATSITIALRIIKNIIKARMSHNKNFCNKLSANKRTTLINNINYLAIAYERYVLSKKNKKLKKRGFVILCDRYAGSSSGVMDSPRIIIDDNSNNISRLMFNFENLLYSKIVPSDLILKLDVCVEELIIRNRNRKKFDKETDEEIKIRFEEMKKTNYICDNIHIINANKNYEYVYSEAKKIVWKNL